MISLTPLIDSKVKLNICFYLKIGSRGFLTDLFGGATNLFRQVDDFGTEIAKGAIREIDRGVKTASEIGAGALNQG